MMATSPPTTPPAMAPVFDPDAADGLGLGLAAATVPEPARKPAIIVSHCHCGIIANDNQLACTRGIKRRVLLQLQENEIEQALLGWERTSSKV